MSELDFDSDKKVKILEAIENHNLRDSSDGLNLESHIVMDADILDEVGALSILWDAMAEALKSEATYMSAYERIIDYSGHIDKSISKLRTEAGRRFYEERVEFIKKYIEELKFELNITS